MIQFSDNLNSLFSFNAQILLLQNSLTCRSEWFVKLLMQWSIWAYGELYIIAYYNKSSETGTAKNYKVPF